MSNNPSDPGNFGSQQFQKLQFGHKPHEEIRTDDVEKQVEQQVAKPARLVKILCLVWLLVLFGMMAFRVVDLSINRDAWIKAWDEEALADIRARKSGGGFRQQILTADEEKEIERIKSWNKNKFTLWLGFTVVFSFASMCFGAFIAVSAHKLINLEGRVQGMVAAIMCLIPFVSPFVILGIPFGIWLLVLLNKDDVKKTFATRAA